MEQQPLDINAAAPRVLEHFIGQPEAQARIKVALEASWADGTRFPHTLMIGPPGVGKTLAAQIIAQEMGCRLREQLGQNFYTTGALAGFLLELGDKEVGLVDEADEMYPPTMTSLYRALEERLIWMDSQPGQSKSQALRLNDFTLLAASNHEYSLVQPLRDRFQLILRFDYYSADDLTTILRQRAYQLGWTVEDEVFALIAARGRGTPRVALRLLQSCRRTTRAEGADIIGGEHFVKTCALEGLDRVGLDAVEQRYLAILAETNRPVRLSVVASRLGLPSRTLSHVVEQFLLREGLITRMEHGRAITPRGIEHLRGVNRTK